MVAYDQKGFLWLRAENRSVVRPPAKIEGKLLDVGLNRNWAMCVSHGGLRGLIFGFATRVLEDQHGFFRGDVLRKMHL